ncbi:MAG: hypothetical protein ACRC9H_19870 [Aeromonas veronii]
MRFILKSNRTGLFLVNVPEKESLLGYKAGWTRRRERAFVFNSVEDVPSNFRWAKHRQGVFLFKKKYTLVLLNPQQQEN